MGNMARTVLVTAPTLAPAGVRRLADADCRVIYLRGGDDAAAVERIMAAEPIDAVISRTVHLTANAIDACPTLKVVARHGVGVTNVDVDACTRRGIPVYVTPGANAQSVAELTVGLIIATARRIAWLDREIRAGRWSRAQDGLELCGRTIGIVGFGQIGQRVARVCHALGMKVLACDSAFPVSAAGDKPANVDGVTMVASLDDLLPRSDIVSLHVPLTTRTRSMIGAAQLAGMPQGSILINTSRGEVVDQAALVAALKTGHLAAAGLDTMAEEPLPPGSVLATLPNVILTPHVGGSTAAALNNMAAAAAANAISFLDGRPADPSTCVNPDVLSFPSGAHSS
jgi:D-3-phosphoglycerate dehydrogenase / 2-oxoglutarate reductase